MVSSLLFIVFIVIYVGYHIFSLEFSGGIAVMGEEILLPPPKRMTTIVVEEAILLRRSIRDYSSDPIPIVDLSMILWAAQGITETRWGLRAAPSAGATYPLEIYVVVGDRGVVLEDGEYLAPGIYKYDVRRHSIILVKKGDYRDNLAQAALDQDWVRLAPVNIVVCAIYERTTSRYGERGIRYVHMEVGHVGQNIYLMATALNLGTVAVGAFYDDRVAEIINAASNEHPLYIMPIGKPLTPYKTSFKEIEAYYKTMRT